MTYGTTRTLKETARASALAAAIVSIAGAGCGDDETGSGGAGGSGGAATVAASSSSSSTATVTVGPGPGPGSGGGGSTADGGSTSSADGGTTTGDGGGGGTTGAGGSGGAVGTGGSGGSGGGPDAACVETAPGETRGSPIAVTPDDGTLVVTNRDAGTVTVLAVADDAGLPAMTERAELTLGGEPWQVAIDACGDRAYVILRREQKVVVIEDLTGTPTVGAEVVVGSEPTGLALSPNGTRLFVANWVDGTVSVIDPVELAVVETIDLNAELADTGLLGEAIAARPALAHPRSVAITNDGDADDTDETVVVTEFFAQRTAPEEALGTNADVNWVGMVYTRGVDGGAVDHINLSALDDIGFNDPAIGSDPIGPAGCFPNQLQSVTVRGSIAYVLSICASPRGPTGGAQVKTMTHPVVSAVNIATGAELAASPVSLAQQFDVFYGANAFVDDGTRRVPLVANDLAFDAETGDAWITANGVDAAFRVVLDDTDGAVTEVGDGVTRPFLDLSDVALDAGDRAVGPIGVAAANEGSFSFVASDITRNVTAIDTTEAASEIAGLADDDARVIASADLPVDADDLAANNGKRAFNTGLDGLSLANQGWGACQVCHFEGLSDNITWYFGRGPRQSPSLEGSFASDDPSDQRIFNWTAVFDEAADFEGVARAINGARGHIVDAQGVAINLGDTTLSPPSGAAGLNGSADELMAEASSLQTWADVKVWTQRLRSPRAPRGLDPVRVAAGAELFEGEGGCVGCHGGAKWTISTLFYDPSGPVNEALKTTAWDGVALAAAGFPTELFPATDGFRSMRRDVDGDQIQCALRPVGTFGISPADVAVKELRANMTGNAQGAGVNSNGFNVPSLLGMSVGAPYFHAGNARTMEELLSDIFLTHRAALADDGFMGGVDEGQQRDALVQYLLSIDESTDTLDIPAVGTDGGDFCAPPPG